MYVSGFSPVCGNLEVPGLYEECILSVFHICATHDGIAGIVARFHAEGERVATVQDAGLVFPFSAVDAVFSVTQGQMQGVIGDDNGGGCDPCVRFYPLLCRKGIIMRRWGTGCHRE